jgi:serine/threonine-protein kinase
MLGEVIHGYRIDRALSSDKGGFGDVFFASHVDSGAEAVVKVLKPEMSALRDIVERFFNEARAAASVHHPGIVQIHNIGYHGNRAYLLMERLHGDDLETRLARGPLPLDRAVVFLRQAAGAIGAAHDRGIVHRDLKPANLFIVADPDVVGGERVKVLDFGIAKLSADAGGGKTQGVFGTPAYMSPEQCASAAAVDARSDLYSLGCIFYELGCGRPPFGHGGLELIAAHLRDTPVPPRAIAPWLPPAIEQVILQLLDKQPGQRFQSCAALIAALDRAAVASGLLGAMTSSMPAVGALASQPSPLGDGSPHRPSGGPPGAGAALPSTLVSAAGAMSTPPARPRGRGLWFGLGAVILAGGTVAVVARGNSGDPSPPRAARDNQGSQGANGSMTTPQSPSAAFRAYAAKTLGAPPDQLEGGAVGPALPPGPRRQLQGEVWQYSMRRTNDYARVARGWVTADGTVIAADQNLGLMFAEAGVWAQGSTQPADERADGIARDLLWMLGMDGGTDLTNGVAIDRDNNMPAPTLTLAADGSGGFRFFAKYQLPESGTRGTGATAYAEIKVDLTADHQARLTATQVPSPQARGGGSAITEFKPSAAFRAHAAKLLEVPPSEVDGGAIDSATAASDPHSRHGAWACVMWPKGDHSREARGWMTADAVVITPDDNLGILFAESGVWAGSVKRSRAELSRLADQLADDLVWSFGMGNRVANEPVLHIPGPSLTLAANGSGLLRFFSDYRRPGPGGAGGGPGSYSEIKVALSADHKATLTRKPFEPRP